MFFIRVACAGHGLRRYFDVGGRGLRRPYMFISSISLCIVYDVELFILCNLMR